ncbi:type II secretion system inner membrane protein GspF [Pseudomonas sp. TE3610]
MATFRYRALDSAGKPVDGHLSAPAEAQAVGQLQERGLLVLHVVASPGEPSAALGLSRLRAWCQREPLGAAQLAQFTQQLATLLGAGQPLDRALGVLLNQPGDERAQRLIARLREQVKGGQPLSAAMAEQGDQFSQLYLSMVRAGEAGGALENTLTQLSVYLERAQALRGEVINALTYPAFLVVGVLGSLALLMAYVVPQFVPIFTDLGVPIPLMTQSVLWLGQYLADYGLWLLAGLMGGASLWAASQQDPERRLRRDHRWLRLRGVGPLLQRLETARLARTLGTLLHNGVSLLSALAIARQVCGNRALQHAVNLATDQVKDGGALAHALGASGLLPTLALQMIQVGEESGQLDRLLIKVADVFDAEARRSIDRLLAALVPSLTIVMAVLVAFIMLAIMLPLMSLTSNI